MHRRGISDVVAVVLMIAVAISIGVFVTTFASKWVQDQTTGPSISCAIKTNYVLEDATYNFTGETKLRIRVANKGEQTLHSFGFVVDNVTLIKSFAWDDPLVANQVTSSNPLKQSEAAVIAITLNDTNMTLGAFESLIRSATKVTVTNEACKPVSASTTTVTLYP